MILETEDTGADPLAVAEAEDGLSVAVVRGTAETIEHRRENGRSRIALTIRTS